MTAVNNNSNIHTGVEDHYNAKFRGPLRVVTALALIALGILAIGLLSNFKVIDLGLKFSKGVLIAGGSSLAICVIVLCILQCKKSTAIARSHSESSAINPNVTVNRGTVASVALNNLGQDEAEDGENSATMTRLASAMVRKSAGNSLKTPIDSRLLAAANAAANSGTNT